MVESLFQNVDILSRIIKRFFLNLKEVSFNLVTKNNEIFKKYKYLQFDKLLPAISSFIKYFVIM